MLRLKAKGPGLGERAEGQVLVLSGAFSARYDLDVQTGKFLRPGLADDGVSVAGRILVADRAKGGVATSWLLNEMVRLGTAPAALVFNTAGPVMIQAAAFAGIPLLDNFPEDITAVLTQGATALVDPAAGLVESDQPVPGDC